MRKTLALLGALIVVIYIVTSAMVAVDETELLVVTHFGKPIRVVEEAGLTFKLPDPAQTAIRLDKRLQALDSNPGEYLTRDKKNLVVRSFVLWRVADAVEFIRSVKDIPSAERRLADLAGSELGAAIGNYLLSDFLTAEDADSKIAEIMANVGAACREQALKEYGIEVVDVRLRRLIFPRENLVSVYNRMRAERERMAKKYRAEGEEEAAKIRAQTDKEVRGILASAYRESQVSRGRGEAEAIRIYAEAFEKDPEFYKFTRTLEAYRKFLDESATLILSSESPLFRYLEKPPEGM
jgi:membrane protease subunit HflC